MTRVYLRSSGETRRAGHLTGRRGGLVYLAVGALFALVSAGAGAAELPLSSARTAGPVAVELLADSSAATPGGTVTLGVQFKIEKGWHIYWRNPGDGGLPTTVAWQVPAGYSVGPTQFPVPRLYIDKGEAATNVLEGQPVLLARLEIPKDAKPGETVEVAAAAKWLVCKDVCQEGSKRLVLSLPIVARPADAKPANDDIFRKAREALPRPMSESKYLSAVSAVANVDRIKPGESFKVAVVVGIRDGYHINAHDPLFETLIPTQVFADGGPDLVIGRPIFPAGEVEEFLPGEKMASYRGRVTIVIPIEADASLEGKEGRISGLVSYQACSDKTQQCYPPVATEWSLTLPVAAAGETVSAVNAEVFASPPSGSTASSTKHRASGTTDGASDGPASAGSRADRLYSTTWLGRLQAQLARLGVFGYLVSAFIGGFLLNLMPCVLPVISIKILSFVQQAKHSRLKVFTLGTAFSLGIFVSFIALGVLIVVLGQQWGGLFQSPRVVIALAAVVTALALSLFGVYTILPPRFVGELGQAVPQEGHLGAFGMGLLATMLGTACTAPCLSAAVAFAAVQQAVVGMLVFVVAGAGMALPYVLLAVHPAWLRMVPKAGPWLQKFELVMGFFLLATVVWLLNTVNEQIGGNGLIWTLLFLLCVSAGVWFYGLAGLGASTRRKLWHYGAAALVIAGGWWLCFREMTTIEELQAAQSATRRAILASRAGDWNGQDIPWLPYTREKVEEAVRSGWTVFVDYTAEWCINCKANEKAVINTGPVREAMQRLQVLPFQADYTSHDPEIKADLEKYNRSGVPMYLVIPAGRPDDVLVLDEVLTPGSLIASLEKAGASTAARFAGESGPAAKPAAGSRPVSNAGVPGL